MTGIMQALDVERRPSRNEKLVSKFTWGTANWLQDSVVRTMLWTGALILAWYCLSTSLSVYNKQLVGKNHGIFGKGAFPAPLFMSSLQFAFQTLLAKLVFKSGLMSRTAQPIAWKDWSKMVLPNGVVTGLDIGFSNKSLVLITMSFYTMCKSTTPIFLLTFAFIWGLERPSWELAGVVTVIVTGLLLLVYGESEFDLLGFTLVMTASCLSGLRFTLTQVLLHGHGSEHVKSPFGGPLEILEILTPVMAITTLILSIAWEQIWWSLPESPYFASWGHSMLSIAIIFLGAVIAFLMVWTEYQVIKETSALTFMIAGTCKEVVTILAAMMFFGDHLGVINGVGLVIVILGVLLFNAYKYRKLKVGEIQAIRAGVHVNKDGVLGVANSAGKGATASPLRESMSNGVHHESTDDDGVVALEYEPLLPMSSVMIRR
eukprot:jgi/Chrzof1/3277/Cz12g19080.t1